MNPQIIKQGTILLSEQYSTTPLTIGQFDATDAGANNAILFLVPHSKPVTSFSEGISGLSFNNVTATLIGTNSNNANNNRQPRMSLYIITNPAKVVGDVKVWFTVNAADIDAQISVLPILLSNVNTATPFGAVVNNYVPVIDLTLDGQGNPYNDTNFDVSMNVVASNSLLFGAYVAETPARGTFVTRLGTTQVAKQTITWPNNGSKLLWVGDKAISTSGTLQLNFSQTTYPDTLANMYVEILSSDVMPTLHAPYTIKLGTTPTVTFTNIATPPTTVILECGGLQQTLNVNFNAGVYTITMPTFSNNRVLFGPAFLRFTDGGNPIVAEFTYEAPTQSYRTQTANASSSIYPGWSTPPLIGDQIVYDAVTTNATVNGYLEAYSAGTYSFYIIRAADGTTEQFNVTFGETTILGTIDSLGTDTNLSTGMSAKIKLTSGSTAVGVMPLLLDVTSGQIFSQPVGSWDSGTKTYTFTVDTSNGFVSWHTYKIRLLLDTGSYVEYAITLTSVSVMDLRGLLPNASSPKYDGNFPLGNR